MANNPETLCFAISSQLPRTSVSSGWQRFLAEHLLSVLMSNSAQVAHQCLKMWAVAMSLFSLEFLSVVLTCISAHLKHTKLLALSLANKSICFPKPFTEPMKWYDYLPGCLALQSGAMPGHCITCKVLRDCLLNVINNVAVICNGNNGVVLGLSIVSHIMSVQQRLRFSVNRAIIYEAMCCTFVSRKCTYSGYQCSFLRVLFHNLDTHLKKWTSYTVH